MSGALVPSERSFGFREQMSLLLVVHAPEMPEERFWELVEEIGWGRPSTDIQSLGARLAEKVSLLDCVTAANRAHSVCSRLGTRIEQWEEETGKRLQVGDDSFSDLRNHIIGLGKAESDRVMQDPALALERAEKRDYKESFAYVFQRAEERFSEAELVSAARSLCPPKPFTSVEALKDDDFVEHPAFGPGVVRDLSYKSEVRVVFGGGDLVLTRA
jgi:hypothetical protein